MRLDSVPLIVNDAPECEMVRPEQEIPFGLSIQRPHGKRWHLDEWLEECRTDVGRLVKQFRILILQNCMLGDGVKDIHALSDLSKPLFWHQDGLPSGVLTLAYVHEEPRIPRTGVCPAEVVVRVMRRHADKIREIPMGECFELSKVLQESLPSTPKPSFYQRVSDASRHCPQAAEFRRAVDEELARIAYFHVWQGYQVMLINNSTVFHCRWPGPGVSGQGSPYLLRGTIQLSATR